MPRANPAVVLAVAGMIGVGLLIASLEWARRQPDTPVTAAATAPAVRLGVLQVTDAVRSLKLVTWQFETTINAESVSDKWYGSAVASVQAPVKYQYGVNLEGLRREDILFGDDGSYVFLVPAPERISVEVDIEKLEERLRVSGARWKSQNQAQLDAARAKLKAVAQGAELSAEDKDRLREVSREQIERLLRNVIGADAATHRMMVRFAE